MKRKIKPALLNYLDLKLSNHGAAKLAIEEKDARSLLMYVAEICIGEKEENGDNHGTFVELCQRTVDNNANGESWCMCFIQSVIAYVEEKTGEVSLIAASENCLEVWEQTSNSQIVKNYPARGAIAIWRHPNTSTKTKRNPPVDGFRKYKYEGAGHTGFVTEFDPDIAKQTMKTIEGNTPTGFLKDGVKIVTRNKKAEGDFEVVGFLIPFPKKQ